MKEEVGGECKGKRPQERKKREMEGQYTMVMRHIHYTQFQPLSFYFFSVR